MNILSARYNSTAFKEFDLDYLLQAADTWKKDNALNTKELEINFNTDSIFNETEFISFVKGFSFSNDFIFFLASIREGTGTSVFPESFLNYLQRFKFTIEISIISLKDREYNLKLIGKEIEIIILQFLLAFFGSEN